ncbi:hypothetical protein GALMADRAFT_283968 [Galerina marginata CBS 339.88]|uniref:Ricin B lectin domain-containing protein n=1 Tax=Galerina marginata (strain CBS 339.88) TaxID=685588 RepID=A0A067S606_GALM3|nr:hypothetical protein GALMADRAFT_283968 [Galerina marginata CBS 339.88]
MSLSPGIYLIKNRSTAAYVRQRDEKNRDNRVVMKESDGEILEEIKIGVVLDENGFYALKSKEGTYIVESKKTDPKGGVTYPEWQKSDGDFIWDIRNASTGLWTIKIRDVPKFWAHNSTDGLRIVPAEEATTSELRWEFINISLLPLPPGDYFVKNRKTGYYIIPKARTSEGDLVTLKKFGKEPPAEAMLNVTVDQSGLFTLKSGSNHCIGDSGVQHER